MSVSSSVIARTPSLLSPHDLGGLLLLLFFTGSQRPSGSPSLMSKRRGLSLEEKRGQLLQIFYESQDFYLLRELEKLGPKKGVISQTVKDVLQTLVDDDLVFKDKIGTSVYFWSLPSCAGNQLRRVRAKHEADLENAKQRQIQLQMQRESLKKGREDTVKMNEMLLWLD
eukprot:c25787_g1_i1 orf=105-611(+)